MTNVLIIEDEQSAYQNLTHLLNDLDEDINVVDWLQSVEQSIKWFETNLQPDLIFLDIQLSDDLSFKLFESVDIKSPIIFTTAFNEFAIRAFEVNSIDYLLKPLSLEKVKKALLKFKQQQTITPKLYKNLLDNLKKHKNNGTYKERFLINSADELIVVKTSDIAYFYRDHSTYLVLGNGKKYPINYSLEKLEELIDPQTHYRLNRQVFSALQAISKITLWYNSKLKIILNPNLELDVFVSREKSNAFKKWIDS
jgi:DNA-binding LytR/AlgR family response regulator